MEKKSVAVTVELKAAVSDLYDDYAQTIDDEELDRWPDFFTEDALYRVISRESHGLGLTHATIYCEGLGMIRDRANMIDRVSVYEPRVLRHFISGLRIHSASEESVQASANFLIIESLFDAEPTVLMVGQYRDEIVRKDGQLRFRRRDAIYDQYRIRTTLVMPV